MELQFQYPYKYAALLVDDLAVFEPALKEIVLVPENF